MPLTITKSGSPGRRVLNVLEFVLILIMLYYSITGFSGQLLFEQDQCHQHSLHYKAHANCDDVQQVFEHHCP
jgi:lipid-A-disaccharide synthase-like uncharacterized protein